MTKGYNIKKKKIYARGDGRTLHLVQQLAHILEVHEMRTIRVNHVLA